MAETRKAKAAKPRTKRAGAASGKKPAPSAAGKPADKPARTKRPAPRPRRATSQSSSGFDIGKLIDHPLVADLLAVGAMAAVAAIADHHVKTRTGQAETGSSKAVKAAGKAAASAIGRRLMTEVDSIKKVSKPATSRRGSK